MPPPETDTTSARRPHSKVCAVPVTEMPPAGANSDPPKRESLPATLIAVREPDPDTEEDAVAEGVEELGPGARDVDGARGGDGDVPPDELGPGHLHRAGRP